MDDNIPICLTMPLEVLKEELKNYKAPYLTEEDGKYLDWRAKYIGMPDNYDPYDPLWWMNG